MAVEQIAAKDMPPENAKTRPSDAEREHLLSGLRQVLDRAEILLVNAMKILLDWPQSRKDTEGNGFRELRRLLQE